MDRRLSRRVLIKAGVAAGAAVLTGAGVSAGRLVAGVFQPPAVSLTHGVASGDVTPTAATVWARASEAATLHVECEPLAPVTGEVARLSAPATAASDFAAQVRLEALRPDTVYAYRAWVEAWRGDSVVASPPESGRFKTAPDPSARVPVAFVFGGDLGGLGYCRREGQGYDIFAPMAGLEPDFFLFNGDQIYADHVCPSSRPGGGRNVPSDWGDLDGRATDWTDRELVREIYYRHWRYNRAGPHLQRLLKITSYYSQWDDHEVINNYGGSWTYWNEANRERLGYRNLVAAGRHAFFAYAPMPRHRAEPDRIYRSFRWGRHLELFILDCRSYRSRTELPDGPEKTMLGAEQLAWLKHGLATSTATWKIVSSDVTLSTGTDGWAPAPASAPEPGYRHELTDLIGHLQAREVENLVVVSTEVHRPAVIRYEADVLGTGRPLLFHEVIAGPLSSSVPADPRPALDATLNPRLLYSEGSLFNFAYFRTGEGEDGQVHLMVDVRGEDGQVRPGSAVDLAPRAVGT